jgi:hypothetical protein
MDENKLPLQFSKLYREINVLDCTRRPNAEGHPLRLHAQATVEADGLRVDHGVAHDAFHLNWRKREKRWGGGSALRRRQRVCDFGSGTLTRCANSSGSPKREGKGTCSSVNSARSSDCQQRRQIMKKKQPGCVAHLGRKLELHLQTV